MFTLASKPIAFIALAGVAILSLAAIAAAYCADAKLRPRDRLPAPPQGQQWQVVFHDEFDGATPDASKWDVPEYKRRDAQWSRKAISLDGQGHLVLSMFKEGAEYYDGCVRTIGKFEHAFGYYVARIKLQKQPGHWSAFWLYNGSVGKIGNEGRDGSEIDILEKPWLDDRVPHTIHWDGYGKEHQSQGTVAKVPGVMVGWHTFSLMWTPEEYVFFVDGKETWRTKAGGVCQVPLYVKLSDEAELKGWAGDLTKAELPDQTLVDYVRVYDLVNKSNGRPAYPVPAGTIPKGK